jgi:hypothetical protein
VRRRPQREVTFWLDVEPPHLVRAIIERLVTQTLLNVAS